MTYGYVRVSSRDQNEERQMIAMQDFGVEKKQIYLDKQSGKATIRSTVEGSELREYSVKILKVYTGSHDRSRNMLLKVTDPALLSITGGIVQGMSGSPIIQDGERCDRCRWRSKGAERVAAVDKIEEKRKPQNFIGHRNRNTGRCRHPCAGQ